MVRIGISGWLYPRWRGTFYPEGLRRKDELAYCGRTFDSVEINGSFYSLQRPACYAQWHAVTPPDFVFAVKGGRFITHMKKLRDVETATANFFASGLLLLREKLGPIVWQLPPNFGFDEGRFRDFFALLPTDTRAAARLARRHDDKVAGRAYTGNLRGDVRPLRHAVEVRHASFANDAFYNLLRDHGVALVVADTAGRFPMSMVDEPTADFAYARLHGDTELYTSGYGADAIARWAARVRAWERSGRDGYVYFDNDAKVHAPFDALALAKRLQLARRVLEGPPWTATEVNHDPRRKRHGIRRPRAA